MFVWREKSETSSTPVVTLLLIAANILTFVGVGMATQGGNGAEYGVNPGSFKLFSLLTAPFLHGGCMHLLGNMYFLWVFGQSVEEAIGRMTFFSFYMLFGLIAGIADLAARMDSNIPAIGASGAISGVMAMYCVLFPASKFKFFSWTKGVQGISSVSLLTFFFIMDLIGGLFSLGQEGGGIAHFAHLGGTFTGFFMGFIFKMADLVTVVPAAAKPDANTKPLAPPAPKIAARPLVELSPQQALLAAKKRKEAAEAQSKSLTRKFFILLGTGFILLLIDAAAALVAGLAFVLLAGMLLARLAFVWLLPMLDTPMDFFLKWLSRFFWVWYALFWILWLILHSGRPDY